MVKMSNLLLLNGPNLNLLGSREPDRYGHDSLEQIEKTLLDIAAAAGHTLHTLQSNAEHELLDSIQACRGRTDMVIINPGALTHTSIALRDALLAVNVPFVEVHLSNPQARESFRRRSLLSDIAVGTIAGFGAYSYTLALQAAIRHLQDA
ncbi:MAG: type II 3-dehydroquinate dehydratase, partial [Gammaproteobacteria bacterium]|nr:type II 3-dehydroquinate dehydratase [Gammaproteobacteria bacterium]